MLNRQEIISQLAASAKLDAKLETQSKKQPDASPIARTDAKSEAKSEAKSGGWVVDVFDQLPSTSDFLRETQVPENESAIELCATDWQTAGHGRRGKGWSSQRGNVTFTLRQLIHRPAIDLLGLSLVTGLGVVSVLNRQLGIAANLKWPNDVLVDGRKLGGLLIELTPHPQNKKATYVMTGIGLNIRHQPEFDSLGIGATSLEVLGTSPKLDRNALIAALSASAASYYVEFETAGWQAFEDKWRSADALFGRAVTVTGGSELEGKACGVNSNGALLVETAAGIETVMAGEVSVRTV